MKTFLQLFPAFRALVLENRKLRDQASVLESRMQDARNAERYNSAELNFWKAKSKDQDAELRRLNDLMHEEIKKVAEAMSLQATGRRIFTKAPPPDASQAASHTPPATKAFGRAAVAQQTNAVREKLTALWESLPGPEKQQPQN